MYDAHSTAPRDACSPYARAPEKGARSYQLHCVPRPLFPTAQPPPPHPLRAALPAQRGAAVYYTLSASRPESLPIVHRKPAGSPPGYLPAPCSHGQCRGARTDSSIVYVSSPMCRQGPRLLGSVGVVALPPAFGQRTRSRAGSTGLQVGKTPPGAQRPAPLRSPSHNCAPSQRPRKMGVLRVASPLPRRLPKRQPPV